MQKSLTPPLSLTLRGKKKTIRARREYDAAKEQRHRFVVVLVFTAAHISNVQKKKKRVLRKGEVSPPQHDKKKAWGSGLTVRSRLLDPQKKFQFLRPLCLSLSGRVETMKRTFGERRARARGEVSHDPLSLLFLFVCVCARFCVLKKNSPLKRRLFRLSFLFPPLDVFSLFLFQFSLSLSRGLLM